MEMHLEPTLEPEHKIFLSHSGEQKEFVELLCEALESRWHTPFFDKRLSSLPKGETFANLIFRAVEQCEMMVVVVSDDYFMSKWPMMELEAFVGGVEENNERRGNTRKKYILPLFYKLSVEEFHERQRREKWMKAWMVVKEGSKRRRIDVDAWEKAVGVLGSYNGIVYKFSGIRDYLNEIVSHICGKINADVKWDDSHVQGKTDICKALHEKIQSVGCSDEHGCKILGIYGVGGIGKTTICKALCNELSNEYDGRVCHIELETQVTTLKETTLIVEKSLRQLVMLLTNMNVEFVQTLDEGKCKTILRKSRHSLKSFIAIDNVWDNEASIVLSKMILEILNFHEENLVIVTARSRDTLEMLGICSDVCVKMPKLGEIAAAKLFLYHAAGGKEFGGEEEKRDMLRCIERCYFHNSGGHGSHYHPLALRALGVQLGCLGKKPSEWVEKLPRVRNFNYFGKGNSVFDILRSSFDMLGARKQSLFMDLVVYRPFGSSSMSGCNFVEYADQSLWKEMVEWLCMVHKVDEAKLQRKFDGLKRKALLQDVNWTCGRINVHDLYMEFAELESRGKFDDSEDLEHRRYMNIRGLNSAELNRSPSGKCWQRLSRVFIRDRYEDYRLNVGITCLRGFDERFSNVVVLKLELSSGVLGSLNLRGVECLVSLSLLGLPFVMKIEGLSGLRKLTYFKCRGTIGNCESIFGQLSASLKVVDIYSVLLRVDALAQCSNLLKLKLQRIESQGLDLSSCSSLQDVDISWCSKLQTIDLSSSSSLESMKLIGVENLKSLMLPHNSSTACGFKSLEVIGSWILTNLSVLDLKRLGVERLVLWHTPIEQLADLRKCTKLQDLELQLKNELYLELEQQGGAEGARCFFPRQLRKLKFECASTKAPSLSGCTRLEALDLDVRVEDGMPTDLKCVENLPFLQSLKLTRCTVTSGWPDLSRSKKLGTIELYLCQIELHENDIRMLTLPLRPLIECVPDFKLDLVRRKVRTGYIYESDRWKESDLGTPPIKINRSNKFVESNHTSFSWETSRMIRNRNWDFPPI